MSISLSDAYQAISDKLKAKFPKITVVQYDPAEDLSELAPACLLDIEEFSKTLDQGSGTFPVKARISIHCVLSAEVKNLQLELREFAVSVSQFIHDEGIWFKNSSCSDPSEIEAFPGNFRKGTHKAFDSWVVTWEQEFYLGESKWSFGAAVSEVRYAVNPADSNDESQYKEVGNAGVNSVFSSE